MSLSSPLFVLRQFVLIGLGSLSLLSLSAQKIDRKKLVTRHNLHITNRDLYGNSQVGNGHFAFGIDITGLQSFNRGANTMSDWGWHKFAPPGGADPYNYSGNMWLTQNKYVNLDVENEQEREMYQWMRANPHRLNLGRLKFILKTKSGDSIFLKDLESPEQHLDLWTGVATSTFSIEGKPVKVTTIAHPNLDMISVKVEAPQLNDGRLSLQLDLPYATNREFSNGADFGPGLTEKHTTTAVIETNRASFHRQIDSTQFDILLSWKGRAKLSERIKHSYSLMPHESASLEVSILFTDKALPRRIPGFEETKAASIRKWNDFWNTGGAIDLSESKDPRWKELERRIVLSQYLMEVNEAGELPPQESGLVNNGWYGKYHFEMLWWHAAHYGLWGRMSKMDGLTKIYRTDWKIYEKKAQKQGYSGVRWPKTLGGTDHWEWPNETNPLLIWQQPHPIFFAELEYRSNPVPDVVNKWRDVVLNSADFMASYPFYHEKEKRYILGYPLQVVSENADPRSCINPTFELSYWRTGLRLAQQWRKRLGLEPNEKYNDVLNKLSALPVVEGRYVSWENIYDMWHVYNFEHPGLIGAYGLLPGDGVDIPTMDRTLSMIEKSWNFDYTWGWDFPMLAMCAARLGHADRAIKFLLDYKSFTWDEHGLCGGGVAPFPYFPSNGGFLYAIAMMAEGWDGSEGSAPGFPKDGRWKVKYEGLKKAL